jgi:hypothetical protein
MGFDETPQPRKSREGRMRKDGAAPGAGRAAGPGSAGRRKVREAWGGVPWPGKRPPGGVREGGECEGKA